MTAPIPKIEPEINQTPRETKNGTQVPPPNAGLGKLIVELEILKALPVKIHLHDRIYAFMSGKKTLTGIALMIAGGALAIGPGTQIVGYKMLGEGVFALGTTMLGGGLVNKVQKADDPTAGQVVKTDWLSAIISILKKILELLAKIR